MILQTPIFRAIKEKYPGAYLHVLAGRQSSQVIMNNPYVDKISIFDKSPLKLLKLLARLATEKFDYYIDPKDHDSTESYFLARMIRAEKKIGYHSGGKVYDIIIPSHAENAGLYYTEIGFRALECIGIYMEEKIPMPELYPNPGSESYTAEFLGQGRGKPVILINISAGKTERNWKKEKWAEFIGLLNTGIYDIVISSAQSDKQSAEFIRSQQPAARLFYSRNMNDVISLVKASGVVISPDTSIVHVASAFDKPLIAMYNYSLKFYPKFRPLCTRQIVLLARGGRLVRDIEIAEIAREIENNDYFTILQILIS